MLVENSNFADQYVSVVVSRDVGIDVDVSDVRDVVAGGVVAVLGPIVDVDIPNIGRKAVAKIEVET